MWWFAEDVVFAGWENGDLRRSVVTGEGAKVTTLYLGGWVASQPCVSELAGPVSGS